MVLKKIDTLKLLKKGFTFANEIKSLSSFMVHLAEEYMVFFFNIYCIVEVKSLSVEAPGQMRIRSKQMHITQISKTQAKLSRLKHTDVLLSFSEFILPNLSFYNL